MTNPTNDVVGVRGRGTSDLKFYRRSNGIKLHGYKYIRSVKTTDPYGYDFDEYVHKDDYERYLAAYREAGLL